MSTRFLSGFVCVFVCSAVFAQKLWTAPRTPDGQPDLQGVWTNSTMTPLERPADLAGKEFFTEQEAREYEAKTWTQINSERRDGGAEADVARSYNEFWRDRPNKIVGSLRTSLVYEPKDGKVPALTPEAQKRIADANRNTTQHSLDGPEYQNLWVRCITRGVPMVPGPYNNDFQIVQSKNYVVIFHEMIHEARVIPLDGSPHPPANIRFWTGDARGRWEGDTLVVDSTNFSEKSNFRGASENLHLVERFSRVTPEMIRYTFTVEDPTTFTKPWSAELPMMRMASPIIEYACNEGNYAMSGILSGARAQGK